MSFDNIVNRLGTGSSKWDLMERGFGVPENGGLAMWIADMDFAAPEFLQKATQGIIDNGNYGYFCGMEAFHEAMHWWMDTRHGWKVDPAWTFVTFGLGHGIATAMQAFTEKGDRIATFTPVYHEFQSKIEKSGRVNTQLPLIKDEAGRYIMDFDAYDTLMTGEEKILLISSPHNPAGRVWTQDELTAMAAFVEKHDLLLIADEIHHDLVYSGHKHLVAPIAMPEIADRMIITTAASKTFNVAGGRCGCVVIPNESLRATFKAFYDSFDINPNLWGVELTKAAYSPEGAAWVDQLVPYIEENYRTFKSAMDALPGIEMMPMESTYLSWVNFENCGLSMEEVNERVYKKALIAATPGKGLGNGGETYLRFNIGTQRARINEAADRLADVFSDLNG
ncbi:MalY/PatB family protein [Cognatishimia activa]|uniref:MalY/PatB family protein n=1 Tax=Cognatishimia activa TaxID=1715691 RepID=UPI0022311FB9|nr:aminotransferase class I/II-fold pyridoxal phosphate-dependent enzyme [Cognatishimia activa]UZD90465.1 aminotransferase class I/II-fold pyridoxal phosphate-dependent enzyme [Cognatishimia activa]